LSVLVYHVFGRFSVRGVQKTPLKNKSKKINLALVLFWPLTHPPRSCHGGHRFFWRPLVGHLAASWQRAPGLLLASCFPLKPWPLLRRCCIFVSGGRWSASSSSLASSFCSSSSPLHKRGGG
jgi:hypothetical protein